MKPFDWINGAWVLAVTLGVTVASCTLQSGGQRLRPLSVTEPAETRATLQAAYGKLPLHFEANQGQNDARVQFLARGHSYSLFLTATEAVLALGNAEWGMRNAEFKDLPSSFSAQPSASKLHPPSPRPSDSRPQTPDSGLILRLQLVGANPNPQVRGLEELPGKVNYLLGNDPTQWRTNLPTYAKVQYQGVYPGVDLVYYGNQRQLEYDFIVTPGADPKAIQLTFAGADTLEVDAQGDLILHTVGGELRLHKPRVYQELNGVQHEVAGRYVLLSEPADSKLETRNSKLSKVGFAVAAYDPSKPLIIDPVLSYSTYLGGGNEDPEFGSEVGFGIAVDPAGNAYVTGQTSSTNFPAARPFQSALSGTHDAFVTKLNAAGSTLLYSTYLGGSSSEASVSIAVDTAGNAYVTGWTNSPNFPTTAGSFQHTSIGGDAFVTKLNAAGSALLYSTYLGGSGAESGRGIAIDTAGNAYVTGETESFDFPTANPLQSTHRGFSPDAFVTKLNAAGSALLYSTYLGGSRDDFGKGIAVGPAGDAYVTGYTNSTDFPRANPLQPVCDSCSAGFIDAFVTKLNATGSALVYSTYLGGHFDDIGWGIAVGPAGDAYVTGKTESPNFPTANPLQPTPSSSIDAFVTKLNATGSALLYSTYLGGSGDDFGDGIAVDAAGNAYVTGGTGSTDFPTAKPLQPAPGGGFSDSFVTKLNAAGSAFVYSTYLGGSGNDSGDGIAVDAAGNAYVTGGTGSTDFPTAKPLQPAPGGGPVDAFVAKIAETARLSVSVRGLGTVTSRPRGIQCPRDCGQDYINGTVVTLAATPARGWRLAGWSACHGKKACVVNLKANRRVTALFAPRTIITSDDNFLRSPQRWPITTPTALR